MHNAPAVAYPVGRSHFQAWLLGLLLGFAVLVLALWCVSVDVIGWRQVLVGGLTTVISGVMWRSWWRAPHGQLSWDGGVWHLTLNASTVRGKPELILDFQVAILLRFVAAEKKQIVWVWLEQSAHSMRWLALRRAIHDGPSLKVQATPDGLSALERRP